MITLTIGTDLDRNIEESVKPLLSGKFRIKGPTPQFRFKAIIGQDIREVIAKTASSKSVRTDTVSSYVLKLALPFLENPMIILFNISFDTSIFHG